MLIRYEKHALKAYLEKLWEIDDFTLLNKSTLYSNPASYLN